jgi:hypothetical protein
MRKHFVYKSLLLKTSLHMELNRPPKLLSLELNWYKKSILAFLYYYIKVHCELGQRSKDFNQCMEETFMVKGTFQGFLLFGYYIYQSYATLQIISVQGFSYSILIIFCKSN